MQNLLTTKHMQKKTWLPWRRFQTSSLAACSRWVVNMCSSPLLSPQLVASFNTRLYSIRTSAIERQANKLAPGLAAVFSSSSLYMLFYVWTHTNESRMWPELQGCRLNANVDTRHVLIASVNLPNTTAAVLLLPKKHSSVALPVITRTGKTQCSMWRSLLTVHHKWTRCPDVCDPWPEALKLHIHCLSVVHTLCTDCLWFTRWALTVWWYTHLHSVAAGSHSGGERSGWTSVIQVPSLTMSIPMTNYNPAHALQFARVCVCVCV